MEDRKKNNFFSPLKKNLQKQIRSIISANLIAPAHLAWNFLECTSNKSQRAYS